MPYSDDLNPNHPGTRRVYGAFVGEMPTEMVEHIERLRARDDTKLRRAAARSGLPRSRKTPGSRTRNLNSSTFDVDGDARGFEISIDDAECFATGIAFNLSIAISAKTPAQLPAGVSSGPVTPAQKSGFAYLGIILPNGSIVTNKKSALRDAPPDADVSSPWLYAGRTTRTTSRITTEYFLSPLPDPEGRLTITISYPDIGIARGLTLYYDICDVPRNEVG